MNRLPTIGQKYDVFIASIVATTYSQSQILFGLGDYTVVITHWYPEIIDATQVNTNFSCQINDTYKWSDAMSISSSISINTSAIILSTKKTLSQDINCFKDGAYLIQISNEQLAHFIGATYL